MPTPLSPSSSQEIICLTPLPLPTASSIASSSSVKPRAQDEEAKIGASEKSRGKRKAEAQAARERVAKMSRAQTIEHMLSTRGKSENPVTNSDLYSRTDHFVSCATGHQQSNRGGGSAGAKTYWDVRTAKVEAQSRGQSTSILAGCVIAINGSTGPQLSNLQLQNMITQNGGRFSPHQTSACTHVVASNLSGTKAQKFINGQGSRGAARRTQVVRVEWVLDSVKQGRKLSEAGYGAVEDPSQPNLFSALGVAPKSKSQASLGSHSGQS